jgi:sulfite reductase (NADPH) hemoprotein beta-component
VPDAIERLVRCYLGLRDSEEERFIDVVHRAGVEPFKAYLYGKADQESAPRDRHLVAA